jgi:cytochrome c553
MRGLLKCALQACLMAVVLTQPVAAQIGKLQKAADIQRAPEALAPVGSIAAGKLKSDDERCQECHGHDGNASDIEDGVGNIGKFPKLAGQHADYIVKQLSDFRSLRRNHEIMNLMAKSLTEADKADIAAYFSSQKKMHGDGKGDNTLGRNLYLQGDASRNILPCISCHTETPAGVTPANSQNPVIGGQHRRYLEKQLLEWRAGARRNSPGDVMNATTKLLTDAEIEALANYVSGL